MRSTHLLGVEEVLALVETHDLLLHFLSRVRDIVFERPTPRKVIECLVCWNSVISTHSELRGRKYPLFLTVAASHCTIVRKIVYRYVRRNLEEALFGPRMVAGG